MMSLRPKRQSQVRDHANSDVLVRIIAGRVRGDGIFDRGYRRWGLVHAAVVTILVIAAEWNRSLPYSAAALAVWSGLAIAAIYHFARTTHPDGQGPRVPNALTATRGVSSVLLLLGLASASLWPTAEAFAHSTAGWWLVGALLVVECTDFLDGRIARRVQAGRFGSVWDMENDAVFALSLSVVIRHVHDVGIYVLLIGLMRYLYVLLWHLESRPVATPRIQKLFSKTTTAVLVTAMIVVLAPTLDSRLRVAALVVVLAMQVVSFGWDMVLQYRARP